MSSDNNKGLAQSISLNGLTWAKTLMICAILLCGGIAAYLGANVTMNFSFESRLTNLENRMDIPLNSTVSAFVKEANYIVSVHEGYYCLFNGTDDRAGKLEYFSTNKTQVQQFAIGNLTSGGLIFLKDNTLNGSLIFGSTVRIIESCQGTLTQYSNSMQVDFPEKSFGYLIDKAGSTYYMVRGNDSYLQFSSTNASVVINSAIGNSTFGGFDMINLGNFTIDASLILKSGVKLVGMGPNATILTGTTSLGSNPVINITGTSGSPLTDIALENFEIDGSNMQTAPYQLGRKGISGQYARRCTIQNIYVHNTPATGIGIDNLVDSAISDCVVVSCGTANQTDGSNGIGIGVGAWATEPTLVTNNFVSLCANNGIALEANATCQKQIVSENHVYQNRIGLRSSGASQVQFVNNQVYNNTDYNVAVTSYGSVNASDVLVEDNVIANSSTGVLVAGSQQAYVENNVFITNTLAINNAGTGTVIKNNDFHSNTNVITETGSGTVLATLWTPNVNYDTTAGYHPARDMPDGSETDVRFELVTPSDFHALVKAQAIIIASGTGDFRRSVQAQWGVISTGNYNTGSGSIAAGQVAVTANVVTAIDITAALTNLPANAIVGIQFRRGADNALDTVNAECFAIAVAMYYV